MLAALGSSTTLMSLTDRVHDHAELMGLLARIDAPLRRMNDDLKNIHDGLEGEYFNKATEQRIYVFSVETHENCPVAFA